ncbi:hypothetical protein [Leifsonia poae]|nr:hypothetical protein [Leifsonia poae]
MNTTRWRSFAAFWRQLADAMLSDRSGARDAHPPDLHRSQSPTGTWLR